MKIREHGTASMYAAGCRCAACVKANGARVWAKRKAADWTDDLDLSALFGKRRAVKFPAGGKECFVSAEAIRRAVAKHANLIKVEALTIMRNKEDRNEK